MGIGIFDRQPFRDGRTVEVLIRQDEHDAAQANGNPLSVQRQSGG